MKEAVSAATLASLPQESRPREKLLAQGAENLSDVELLAVLLGSGNKAQDVLQLAKSILPTIDIHNGILAPKDLLEVHGLGPAKSCLLIAAFEFARRRIKPRGIKITQAADVLPLVSHLSARPQEHFIAISLNGAHEVIACRVLTIGLINASQVHPREVFCDAISDRACAIIVAHNHPSGDLTPSDEDRSVTSKLKAAGEILGITLLDHVIFAHHNFISFRERNLL